MQISVLPKEILQNIMKLLDRESLYSCRQVCQAFYCAASVLYLKEVYIFSNHKKFLESTYESSIHGRSLGKYIEKLVIKPLKNSTMWLNTQELEKLLENLPYLNTLEFDEDRFGDTTVTTDYYIQCMTKMKNLCLPSLKHFICQKFMFNFYCEHYDSFEICYRLREQLVTASFCLPKLTGIWDRFSDISFLSEFKSLRYLSLLIYNPSFRNISLPKVLYYCPNLKFLALRTEEDWFTDDYDGRIIYSDLSYPGLETLHLFFIQMKLPQQLYIQNHLPNLKRLEMEFTLAFWSRFYSGLGTLRQNELMDFWMGLDYLSFHGRVHTGNISDLSMYLVFKDRLKQLYEKGYDFSFSIKNSSLRYCAGISIDNVNRKVEYFIHNKYLYRYDFGDSTWTSLTSITPLSTVHIESDFEKSKFDFPPPYIPTLLKSRTKLRRVSIRLNSQRICLGSNLSADWMFKRDVSNLMIPSRKDKESMNMILLSHFNLSKLPFQVFYSITDEIQTIVISQCLLTTDTIDLRQFNNLNKLVLDYSFFHIQSTRDFYIRFKSKEREDIFKCHNILHKESIECYNSLDNIDKSITVLYTQLNQLTIKRHYKILYISKKDCISLKL